MQLRLLKTTYFLFLSVSTLLYPQLEISNRDLENLAIMDATRPTTLERALNHCHTKTGKEAFKQSLQALSCDVAELAQRQEDLKKIIGNQSLAQAMDADLKSCAHHEDALSALKANGSDSALGEFYFKRSGFTGLNEKPAALTASYFFHYFNLFAPLIEHALLHAGIQSVFSKFESHDHDHHHHGCGCSHDHGMNSTKLAYYLVQAAHWGMHVPGYYEIVTHMQNRRKKIVTAQQEIAELKKYMESVHSLWNHLQETAPSFTQIKTPTLFRTFGLSCTSDFLITVQELLASNWDSTVQNSIAPGSILAMHANINKHAADFESLAQEVGIIDAYMNVARLIMHQTDKKPYCFVSFAQSTKPSLAIKQLWHHAIQADTMRALDITIAEKNSCLVVQGPNGCGKSTLLSGVGQALFLAQSWAIAPAQSMILTPFAHIHTHSLKRDAIEQGLSHFYCEHAYYESMFTRSGQGVAIALLDEPYTCTEPNTGARYLADLMQRIEDSASKVAIITTHYDVQKSL